MPALPLRISACAALDTSIQPESRLIDYSPKDRPWDVHRAQADQVAETYAQDLDMNRLADRIGGCSGYLWFQWTAPDDAGETRLKLAQARFCRVRHCPVCQWRRALMWQARFLKALPEIQAQYPQARWIFLTLTIRNCELGELRATLQAMNQGWKRLIERQCWPALGFVRTTEVTKGQDGTAHPHFHALLMVPPAYFGRKYISQAEWVHLWRESMRLPYDPSVHVRVVRPKPASAGADPLEALRAAAAEVLKYSVKPEDLATDPEWLGAITRQLHKLRFVATGGALRDVLREDSPESDQDLVHVAGEEDAPADEDRPGMGFRWDRPARHYRLDSQQGGRDAAADSSRKKATPVKGKPGYKGSG